MSTQKEKDDELIILNDDTSNNDLDFNFDFNTEETSDTDLIDFGTDDSSISSKEEEKTDSGLDFSFDLEQDASDNNKIEAEEVETVKLDENTDNLDFSFELSTDNASTEENLEIEKDETIELNESLLEEDTQNDSNFSFSENSQEETDVSLEQDFISRDSILDEAILKLTNSKNKLLSNKDLKSNNLEDIQSQIKELESQVKDIKKDLKQIDSDIVSIDSDVESLEKMKNLKQK